MNLYFDKNLLKAYKSPSQIARVLTENWVLKNGYCPNCGNDKLSEFENNRPVADFFCASCDEEFELKSKKGKSLGKKIADGAYSTMMERIASPTSPHFFFLGYDRASWRVNNLLLVPSTFIVPKIIEKRKPLAPTAKRAGWVGCNIEVANIPIPCQVFFIKQGTVVPKERVMKKWNSVFSYKPQTIESKGWYFDILQCLDRIPNEVFLLDEMYAFEHELKQVHPENNRIRAKIRQQLQDLRDNGVIEFLSRGKYKKIQL